MPDQPEATPVEASKPSITVHIGTGPKMKPTLNLIAPPGGWNVYTNQRPNPHLCRKHHGKKV